MLADNFRNAILIDPVLNGADRLKIVTGYASHTMASWHLEEIREKCLHKIRQPVEIILLVGMCNADGLNIIVHNGLKQLVNDSKNSKYARITAQYVYKGSPVHSKLYLWEKSGHPIYAYMGSANYTQIAFSKGRREIMTECSLVEANRYFNRIEPDTIYCNHAEIENYIKIYHPSKIFRDNKYIQLSDFKAETRCVKLSFLTRSGEIGSRSGINWGQREGREPNQAYIPLPAEIARSGFFPLDKQHFSVVTDDQKQLILRVEQQNDKAITTPLNNSLLGEYFRNRLGLANGAFVTKEDFERYGRTDVTFYKLDDEQFYMDFSI